jgi:hypothetical protein
MIQPSSVVAVDDNIEELKTIVDALRLLDIACLPVLATAGSVDVLKPLKGVRLIFFDINYLKGVNNEIQMFEVAADILIKVLSKENGPYVLITWSSKSDQHHKLMKFFADEVPEIPAPAITGFLQKEKFTNAGISKDGGASLREEVRGILSKNPQVEALMDWEASARRAAGDVVCSILDLFSRENRFLANIADDLHVTLTHMAKSAVGFPNIAPDRRGAIHEALVPILFDRLIHANPDTADTDIWERAITLEGKIESPPLSHGYKLNSLSHIARPGSGYMNAGDRGVVFSLQNGAGNLFSTRTKMPLQQIAGDFLGSPVKDKPLSLPDMEEFNKCCRWVLIGVRAICDQAQNNGIMRPVVLGVEAPALLKKNLRLKKHGALSLTPTYTIPFGEDNVEEERQLLIDWHWTTSMSLSELLEAKVMYRLREPLMSQISSQMGSYTSRPGIINFS